MKQDEKKMMLAEGAMGEIRKAFQTVVDDYLKPGRKQAHVVGMGMGVKWKKCQPTGEPALIVFVTQKLDKDQLRAADMVPSKLGDMQTDVLTTGFPFAGGCEPLGTDVQSLAGRVRPAQGGFSVGHYQITAGTIGTCVYDMLPGGTVSPPANGLGMPQKFYILSNNHVLANSNNASLGDPILQPGPYDGGTVPADRIATLNRYIPITFEPPVPRILHHNIVDAAVAEGNFNDLDRGIYWTGHVWGWRRKSDVQVGLTVQKTGRTTNYTTGRITALNATIDVGYGGGRVARFKDQIVTTSMSAGGDSGSLVTTLDSIAVGLLFAGSPTATILNQIENVRALLKVEVSEKIR